MSWILNDPPPRYGEELAECQRYAIDIPFYIGIAISTVVSDGFGTCFFPVYIPVTMKNGSVPITVSGQLRVHATGSDYQNVSIYTTGFVFGNIATLKVTGLSPSTVYSLDSATGGHIYIDNNL